MLEENTKVFNLTMNNCIFIKVLVINFAISDTRLFKIDIFAIGSLNLKQK